MVGHIYINGVITNDQSNAIDVYGAVNTRSVIDQIAALPNAESLTVHINSPGGEVDAGFAIYDILRSTGLPITTVVEGQCYSIATVVLMAGDERKATENSVFRIHNPWVDWAMGDAKSLRKTASDLDVIQNKMANLYASVTNGLTTDDILDIMDKDEDMNLELALSNGFLTEILTTIRAVAMINTKNAMSKETIQAPAGFMDKLSALLSKQETKKALVLKAADDTTEVDFYELEEGQSPTVGDVANIAGQPASGEVVMPSGDTYVFVDGTLTEIKAAESATDEMAAKVEELESQLASVKEEVNAKLDEVLAMVRGHEQTYKSLKALVSEVKVEDKKEQKVTAKVNSGNPFGDGPFNFNSK